MTKAIALMALVVGAATIPQNVAAREPRCAKALHREEARLERCHAACDRRAAVRASFDPETCRRRCDVKHDLSVGKLGQARRCRAETADDASAELSYGGYISYPNPIRNGQGLCLDVRNGDSTNRTPVQLYHCNGTDAQDWFVQPNAISGLAGKCLDMPYAIDGQGVWLFDCWGGWNQQWTLTKMSVSYGSNTFPYITGGLNVVSSSNGASVVIDNLYTPAYWTYTASGEIRLPDGRCLQPGWAGAIAVTCNGSTYQKWTFGSRPAGIRWNQNPSYCLAATNPYLNNRWYRSAITIAPCNSYDSHQRWSVASEIRNVTGKCLTFPDGAQDWTPVTVKSCYYSATIGEYHQIWTSSY